MKSLSIKFLSAVILLVSGTLSAFAAGESENNDQFFANALVSLSRPNSPSTQEIIESRYSLAVHPAYYKNLSVPFLAVEADKIRVTPTAIFFINDVQFALSAEELETFILNPARRGVTQLPPFRKYPTDAIRVMTIREALDQSCRQERSALDLLHHLTYIVDQNGNSAFDYAMRVNKKLMGIFVFLAHVMNLQPQARIGDFLRQAGL